MSDTRPPLAALRWVISLDDPVLVPFERHGQVVPGLSWLPLSDDAADGGGCFLLRFAPGAASLPHEHTDTEAFLVLEGTLIDADGAELCPGDFVSYAPGSRHSSHAPQGCTILAFLRTPNRRIGP